MTLARTNFSAVRYVNSSSCLVTIKGIQPTNNQHGTTRVPMWSSYSLLLRRVCDNVCGKNCSSISRHG